MRRYLLRVWCAALLIGFTSAFAGQPPLRVMTYNIRYDNPADSLDNWKYRRDFVANLIHYHAPDILGTQEGLVNQLRDMSARLPEYAHSGKGRDDGRAGGEHCAIFYRADRFKLLDENTFWLSPTPDAPSKGWDAALNRIVSWVALKDTRSGRTFFVFNTHFDHQGPTARTESARLLVEQIHRIAKDAPVVVTGDFNSTDAEASYKILTGQLSDAMTVSQAGHHGPLKTYSGFDVRSGIIGERIDFVFVTSSVNVLRHATLSDFMSNEHFPSDHLPVVTDIVIP